MSKTLLQHAKTLNELPNVEYARVKDARLELKLKSRNHAYVFGSYVDLEAFAKEILGVEL